MRFARINFIGVIMGGTALFGVNGFAPPTGRVRVSSTLSMAALPSPEESSKALSEYMAKSHEEKLRAVREVEMKKNEEIEVSILATSWSLSFSCGYARVGRPDHPCYNSFHISTSVFIVSHYILSYSVVS